MRNFAGAIVFSGIFAMLIFAQGAAQPQPQPLTQQEQVYLDSTLRGWEKSMTDLRSFVTKVDRQTLDKALQTKDQYKGFAVFLKANVKDDQSRARLQLEKVGKPEVFEKYYCTGQFLYEYVPAQKLIRVHDMPQKGKGQQESFLSFLFGMGADEAKKRYEMKPVFPKEPDQYYHYIRIKPKTPGDKNDFSEARLSLLKSNHLPAQIWYLQPNGNEITWTFSEQQIDKDIPLTWFQPDEPKGWTVQRVQQKAPAAQPVIRGK